MDDAARVRVGQRVGDVAQDARARRRPAVRPSRASRAPRLSPSHERHDEVDEPVALVDRVDRDDVRVRELGRRLRLAQEPRRARRR